MRIATWGSITIRYTKSHTLRLLPLGYHPQAYSTSSTSKDNQTEENNQNRKQPKSSDFSAMAPNDKKKPPAIPRPSSSVILISPNNQILLLQRVKQSSSFPSAHVFPGGNVSEQHDGSMPPPDSPLRHVDSETYRMAAIRECFEESGILLARNNGFGRLLELPENEREQGRKAIHANQTSFPTWLAKKGGRADVDGLIPFTRWVTPPRMPRRFTTQMYLYFLPTEATTPLEGADEPQDDSEEAGVRIPLPTTDGGLEHTTARFLPAAAWLRLAQERRLIMYPPQFFLLHQVAQHLDGLSSPSAYGSVSRTPLPREELVARRKKLLAFVKTGSPPWTEKCISPTGLPPRNGRARENGASVLGLEKPGPELEGSDRAGVSEECVLVEFKKDGPRPIGVISREEALGPKL